MDGWSSLEDDGNLEMEVQRGRIVDARSCKHFNRTDRGAATLVMRPGQSIA